MAIMKTSYSNLKISLNENYSMELSEKGGPVRVRGLLVIVLLCVVLISAIYLLVICPNTLSSSVVDYSSSAQRKSYIRAVVYSWLSQRYADKDVSTGDISFPLSPNYDTNQEKVLSCYYNTPNYENSSYDLMPADVNPHLCTHINIAFAEIVNKEIHLDENQKRAIAEVINLKKQNPDLKILLSIGGAGNNNGFSDMVVNHASRKVFIKSIKTALKNLTLDGIDLDWEFPAVHSRKINTTHNRERQHFSQLLREIRMEYIRENRNYLLTVAAGAPQAIVDTSYDVDQLNEYVDFVNIMTYDFHFFSKYTPFTGFNSPLFAREQEKLYLSTLNINYTVYMYMQKGLEPNKIVVGIPTYGHSYSLVNPENTNITSPASGFGTLGSLGFVDYPDICNYIKKYKFDVNIKYDNESKVPYLYRSNEWVSYDTPDSVMAKANYIKINKLRGAMIYSLNADDYKGDCEVGASSRFPLAHSVKSTLIDKTMLT